MDSTLKVQVYDQNSQSNEMLGECDVNLNQQNLLEDVESKVASVRNAATRCYSDFLCY
jgi:hypothetical protein